MISSRHVRVTLIVALIGATAGALAAVVSVGLAVIDFHALGDSLNALGGRILGVAAGVGAAFGALAGPALGWLLLRRVPLGIAAGGVAMGTAIGAVIGNRLLPFSPYTPDVPGVVWGAMAGCALTAVLMRVSPIGRPAATSSPDAV